MSSAFSARRRADQFDALVGDPTVGLDDARFGELLELVGALRSVPAPTPRANFSASLRAQLMAEADTVLLPRDRPVDDRLALTRSSRPAHSRRDRRLAVAAGTLAVVGATTSMAAAAQTALPGDALYPVKRALEDVHAGVSVGDGAKGTALLANASGRLDELGEMVRLGTAEDPTMVPATLAAFVDQAQAASVLLLGDYTDSGDAESVSDLRDFTADSMTTLSELEPALPASARDDVRLAAEALAEIDARASRLCPTCGGSGISQVPLSLLGAASTAVDDLARPTRPLDATASAERSDAGSRGPRPARQPDGRQTAPLPGGASDPSSFGPGSVFTPPSASGGGSGSQDQGGARGRSGGGLDDALGDAGSTGAANDGGPLAPVLDPLLEPVAPAVDTVTDTVDEALGPPVGE